MFRAKVQPTATILAVRIYHSADKRKAAINALAAIRMIAQSRNTVADVSSVFSCAYSPTHFLLPG